MWEATELYWLRRLLRALHTPQLLPLQTIEVPLRTLYGSHWSLTGRQVPGARTTDAAVYLPGRNALLLTHGAIAAARHRISTVALGILDSNPFGDATPRFFRLMAAALSAALQRPIRIVTPLARSSKSHVIRSAAAAGVPLHLTCSCLSPRGRLHCGRCNKCAERRRGFHAARIKDPTHYAR